METAFELGKLLVSLVACQLAGIIGFLSVRSSITDWYSKLIMPKFAPPKSLFGPVWVVLYLLMGIALYLVWYLNGHVPGVFFALSLFVVQLILNTLWSPAFFGLKSPLIGLYVIIPLLVFIILTTVAFLRISLPAGLLMVPYLLWVSFATALNAAIWKLNQ